MDKEIIRESRIFADSIQMISMDNKIHDQEPVIKKLAEIQSELFFFDPNTAGINELLKLGFPERTADNLIKYRKAGGFFLKADDMQKIYGMNEELYGKLKNWVLIESDSVTVDTISKVMPTKNNDIIMMNINNCEFSDLIKVLGNNKRIVSRILNYRDLLGGYYSLNQLNEVYEMSDSILNCMLPYFYADSLNVKKLSLNHSDYRELISHPYLEKEHVKIILKFREYSEAQIDLKEFLRLKILPDTILSLLKPYLKE